MEVESPPVFSGEADPLESQLRLKLVQDFMFMKSDFDLLLFAAVKSLGSGLAESFFSRIRVRHCVESSGAAN